jgi:hypothetical protein
MNDGRRVSRRELEEMERAASSWAAENRAEADRLKAALAKKDAVIAGLVEAGETVREWHDAVARALASGQFDAEVEINREFPRGDLDVALKAAQPEAGGGKEKIHG